MSSSPLIDLVATYQAIMTGKMKQFHERDRTLLLELARLEVDKRMKEQRLLVSAPAAFPAPPAPPAPPDIVQMNKRREQEDRSAAPNPAKRPRTVPEKPAPIDTNPASKPREKDGAIGTRTRSKTETNDRLVQKKVSEAVEKPNAATHPPPKPQVVEPVIEVIEEPVVKPKKELVPYLRVVALIFPEINLSAHEKDRVRESTKRFLAKEPGGVEEFIISQRSGHNGKIYGAPDTSAFRQRYKAYLMSSESHVASIFASPSKSNEEQKIAKNEAPKRKAGRPPKLQVPETVKASAAPTTKSGRTPKPVGVPKPSTILGATDGIPAFEVISGEINSIFKRRKRLLDNKLDFLDSVGNEIDKFAKEFNTSRRKKEHDKWIEEAVTGEFVARVKEKYPDLFDANLVVAPLAKTGTETSDEDGMQIDGTSAQDKSRLKEPKDWNARLAPNGTTTGVEASQRTVQGKAISEVFLCPSPLLSTSVAPEIRYDYDSDIEDVEDEMEQEITELESPVETELEVMQGLDDA